VGKRSDFERTPQDWYPTPAKAVAPLLPHLLPRTRFIEPCAGDGALRDHLQAEGHVCVEAFDINPRAPGIAVGDASGIASAEGAACFITNSPWKWEMLAPIATALSDVLPTWLLLPSDFAHNQRAAPLMRRCHRIVSVGRMIWIPGSKMAGKENCAWYLLHAVPGPCLFFERQPRAKLGNPREEI
jgi:hypothetical protein